MRYASIFAVTLFASFAAHADTIPLPTADPANATYADAQSFINDLAAKYPQTVRKFTLGGSDSGSNVEGITIGTGAIHNLLVSTHHGNEYGATEVGKAFAASVAANPISGQTLYFIPVLNIGGYNVKDRYEADATGASRDPNRDYPGPCVHDAPFHLKDTAGLAQLVDKENIVASATLHTFAPAVMYPWGISAHGADLVTPYEDIFKNLVSLATSESHYAAGNSTLLLYPADGTFEDYAFWKHGIWSLLYELGDSHTPSPDDVSNMIQVNVPGMRKVYEASPTTRATNHAFTGHCDARLRGLDRHDE